MIAADMRLYDYSIFSSVEDDYGQSREEEQEGKIKMAIYLVNETLNDNSMKKILLAMACLVILYHIFQKKKPSWMNGFLLQYYERRNVCPLWIHIYYTSIKKCKDEKKKPI